MDKIQRTSKSALKLTRNHLREIAQLLVHKHLHSDPVDSDPVDSVACFHREDGDVEFMNILANQLSPQVNPLVGELSLNCWCGHMKWSDGFILGAEVG